MREKAAYFVINKPKDFACGFGGSKAESGWLLDTTYWSRVFDSRKEGMNWYKLVSVVEIPVNCGVEITVYATDSAEILVGDRQYALSDWLHREQPQAEKKQPLQALPHKTLRLSPDFLLTDLSGRYLFFTIESVSSGTAFAKVIQMQLYCNPYSWLDFLPEIYREEDDGFLRRYLAIFQTMYEEMEEKIETTAENYTAEKSSYEFLQWLSTWYCMEPPNLWNPQQLRYLVKNAGRIYRQLGTKACVKEICTLYLGEPPEIVEYYDPEAERIAAAYGLKVEQVRIDPFVFTILVPSRTLRGSEYRVFLEILNHCIPAYMEANVLFLSELKRKKAYIGTETRMTEEGGLLLAE
jgi:phage tail-like protein